MTPHTIDGTAILRRPGPGPSLLLLHGIGGDARSWEWLAAAMPAAFDVIAWNAPGYGASTPLAMATPRPADYAQRIAGLLDALGLPQVMLAGQSLGTLFAGAFAAAHPERITALAFFSPALGYRTAAEAPLPEGVQARLDALHSEGAEAFAGKRAARLVFRPERKPELLEAVRRSMAAVNAAGYAQACRALAAGDLLADAARIARPALVAVGAEDVVTPPPEARALHAALPAGSSLHLIPDAGHALPQEAPARLAALLVEAAHG
jgi:pimeloyl-ACP methyl ester carboxylesterase